MVTGFPGFREISGDDEIQRLKPRLNWTHNRGPLRTVADLVPGSHRHLVAVHPEDTPCGIFDVATLGTVGRTLESSLRAADRSVECVYHVWSGALTRDMANSLESDLLLRAPIGQLASLRIPAGHGFVWQLAPATVLGDGVTIATHTDVSELFIGSDLDLIAPLQATQLEVRPVSPATVPIFCR